MQPTAACHAKYVYKSMPSRFLSVQEIDRMVIILATCILLSVGLVLAILLLTWLRQLLTSTERQELINVEGNLNDLLCMEPELINVGVDLDDFIAEFGEEYVDFVRSSSVDSGMYGCDQWE